jgi:hypothetical protein
MLGNEPWWDDGLSGTMVALPGQLTGDVLGRESRYFKACENVQSVKTRNELEKYMNEH